MKAVFPFPLLLTALLLVSACAPTPTRDSIRLTPALEAQHQLLESGRTAVRHARYQEGIDHLSRLVALNPEASLLAETRWWLARAYEESGDLHASQRIYRQLLQEHPDSRHQSRAAARLDHLTHRLQRTLDLRQPVRGILLPLERLPSRGRWESWCAALSDRGVTTIVLDLGGHGGPESKRRVSDDLPRWETLRGKTLHPLVRVAHHHGLTVVAALRVQDLPGIPYRTLWEDWRFDLSHRRLVPSGSFDLFHPDYQRHAMHVLVKLVEVGIDGLLFRAHSPFQLTEGFSPHARRRFEQTFGVEIAPADLFPPSATIGAAPGEYPPLLWRWAGWKARARLDVLASVKDQLQDQYPGLLCGLELHVASVTDPARALIAYGEDWVEAKTRAFDFYLASPSRAMPRNDGNRAGQAADGWVPPETEKSAVRTLAEHLESPAGLWVSRAVRDLDRRGGREALPSVETDSAGLNHVGRIYEIP